MSSSVLSALGPKYLSPPAPMAATMTETPAKITVGTIPLAPIARAVVGTLIAPITPETVAPRPFTIFVYKVLLLQNRN